MAFSGANNTEYVNRKYTFFRNVTKTQNSTPVYLINLNYDIPKKFHPIEQSLWIFAFNISSILIGLKVKAIPIMITKEKSKAKKPSLR